MDKEAIKKELVDKSNEILAKYDEQEMVDAISVMNMAAKTVFLGSLRVYNFDNVGKIKKDLEKEIKSYGKVTIRDEKVVPCCAPSYMHVSFNVSINK
ncbi:MAG: hypothetical protein ACI389_07170 [Methanobrevibacter sp.]|uniref:hypothetical protein n=1 Tax=Methanobrevibacter sp. TaxID=66852 RepID=UPI003F0B8C8C